MAIKYLEVEGHGRLEAGQALGILKKRRALEPSPVRIGHVPGWLRRQIQKRLRGTCEIRYSGSVLLWKAIQRASADDAFDHHGSTKLFNREVYVTEPYATVGLNALLSAKRFADLLDLDFSYSPNSWWNPGETIRLMFWLKSA